VRGVIRFYATLAVGLLALLSAPFVLPFIPEPGRPELPRARALPRKKCLSD
jgi:hypothetical protein